MAKNNLKIIWIIAAVVIGLIIVFFIFKNTQEDVNGSEETNQEPKVLYSNTLNAVTLEIEEINFVETKENYGVLTDMTINVKNKGVSDIFPSIYVLVYDDGFRSKYRSEKRIQISQIINASIGEVSHLKVPIDLGIGGIENNKTVKVTLNNDYNPYNSNNVVTIEFRTNFMKNSNPGILQSLKNFLNI